jgi:putative transposase
MSKPVRNASPSEILRSRTFFVTTKTSMGRPLLQSERNAALLIDVLRSYTAARKFRIDDFVVMPDHLHLLITVDDKMAIEKAVQLIKGGFSYRLKKSLDMWERCGSVDFRMCGLKIGRAISATGNTSR